MDSHWIAIGCPWDPYGIPIASPLGPHLSSNGLSLYVHGIPLGFPLDPLWVPIGFTFDSHWLAIWLPWVPHLVSAGFPFDPNLMFSWFPLALQLVPIWIPWLGFLQGCLHFSTRRAACAPGQCGGAQPGTPCLGTHIGSIPPGMVVHVLQL